MALQSNLMWARCSLQVDPPPGGVSKSKRDQAGIPSAVKGGQQVVVQSKAVLGEIAVAEKVVVSTAVLEQAERQSRSSPVQELLSAVFNVAESFIPFIEPRERSARSDPLVQLEGNFAPVKESPLCANLEVTGTIPACLNGAYIRNGGNPQFPPSAGYHCFDGDGMLHVVRIKDSAASHCCRFTRTNRYLHEKRAGRPVFTKALGELHGLGGVARVALFTLRGLTGAIDSSKGMGSANTGLEFFNGMLLAMSEDDMPYAVRITDAGEPETLGRYNFEGALTRPMTAHPKIDPKTGEMIAYSF